MWLRKKLGTELQYGINKIHMETKKIHKRIAK